MIKTLNNIFRQDREKFVVPKSVQQVIPIQTVWNDGIFKVGRNKFSRSYRFPDINYAVAGKEDKEIMFLDYSDLLNAFDSGATTKITIHNRRLNRQDFEKSILIPMTEDIFFPHGNGTDGAFCKAWLKMRGDGCHGQAAGIA